MLFRFLHSSNSSTTDALTCFSSPQTEEPEILLPLGKISAT